MAPKNLGICVVAGTTFRLPYMTDKELRNVTKCDFAYKLRSMNTALPCESFLVDKLLSVFHVVLDRAHQGNRLHEDNVAIRMWALQQWHKSPGWPSSKTRVLDFQFPNDNLSLLENSVFSCQIQGVKYLLPSFSKKIFTKHVPDVIGFLNLFRRCNKATESITGDVEKQAFGHYVHSYFPHADSSTTSRLLNQFDTQRAIGFLKTDLSLVTAGSIESILPIRPETKNYMVQRNRCVRISIGPRPRLKDSKPKSKVTHLHLGSSLPTAVMDLEAVPNHDSSVALVFRGKKHKKKFLPGLEGMEMIIDGEPRSAEVQIVNTLEDIEITNWFLSVKLMDMITLKTLLQEFFSDRSSLPISLFYSDDSDILSDGGLFIRYDNLPIPLGKYHFDCLVSNTGAKRAIGAEPAASCRICHPPASMANGNGPAKQEMETLRKGLLSYNPEDKLKDNVQISSLKHEPSIEVKNGEMPFSASSTEVSHATDDPETAQPGRKKRWKRQKTRESGSEHDIPLKKRQRVQPPIPETGQQQPSSHHTHRENDGSLMGGQEDMLSALDAHLEQAQARLRARAGAATAAAAAAAVGSSSRGPPPRPVTLTRPNRPPTTKKQHMS